MNQTPSDLPLDSGMPPQSTGPSVKPWIFLGCGCLTLFAILVAGIVGFVFYKIKDSEAGRLVQRSAQESPELREAIGEIQDTGWPLGSISVEGGGSGKATLTMSVKGSKAQGKYYATLIRENGQWRVVSGRLELEDGRSVAIAGGQLAPPNVPDKALPADIESKGGRELKSDRNAVASWNNIDWSTQPIRLEVPSDWEQVELDKRSLEFRPKDRGAYLTGNVTYFDQKIPFENLTQPMLIKASAQLKREEILGYSLRNIGSAQGFLQLERRSDGQSTAVWTGYFNHPEFGTVSVTFLLGAPNPEDFDRYEATLGAILDSIRIQ